MDLDGEERARVPPLWPFLLTCGATAFWIDLGAIHRHHHADSLIPVLASLYRWTPFYWEQDRIGMLVSLLAMPIRHPLANLLVQDFLDIACGLSVFFLLARFIRLGPAYPIAAAIGAASFVALAPTSYQFAYFIDQPYGVSMALGLGGLIVAESTVDGRRILRRLSAALVLIATAHWVNVASALILGPLVVFRFLAFEVRRPVVGRPTARPTGEMILAGVRRAVGSPAGVGLLLLAAGHQFGLILKENARYPHTHFAAMAPARWPDSWRKLLANTTAALAPGTWPMALATVAAIGLLSLALSGIRRRTLPACRAAAIPAAASVAVWLVLGTRGWVEINAFSHRYLIPSVILLQATPATLAAAPLYAVAGPRGRRVLFASVAPALLLAAATRYGLPSLGGVRDDIDRRLGARTPDILAAGCTHVTGGYFNVWPSVFHANLALRDQGDDRVVWGVTFRSHPTRRLLQAVPREALRVAIARGDPMGDTWLRSYSFPPMIEAEERPTIRVLRPMPGTTGRWPPLF